MPNDIVHIGGGAGFAGDRPGAAVAVAEALAAATQQGIPAFLIFEMLAERTLALAQLDRRRDPDAGYSANLTALVQPVLALCLQHNIRIVGNFGAANPPAAARRLQAMAHELGFPETRIAVVTGDDLSARLTPGELAARETDGALLQGRSAIVAANAYLGAQPIAEALAAGAKIVVTGRVADPSPRAQSAACNTW